MQNDLLQNKWKKEQFLLLPRILQIMKQVIQRYETKGFSVIKSVESRGSLIQCPIKTLNFNSLCNVYVTLYKFLCVKGLLFEKYKHIMANGAMA